MPLLDLARLRGQTLFFRILKPTIHKIMRRKIMICKNLKFNLGCRSMKPMMNQRGRREELERRLILYWESMLNREKQATKRLLFRN